jgi:hypothetical protein
VGKSAIAVAVPAPAAPIVPLPVPEGDCDLLELLAGVPDGRTGQGRDHPVAAVLALAAAAVVAGMKGYTAISGWVADVPPPVLAGLYLRCGAAPGPPPSKTTIWRVLTDAGAGELDVAAGTWLMSLAGLDGPAAASGDAAGEDCPRRWCRSGWTARPCGAPGTLTGPRSGCSRPSSARTRRPR